jgi:uncharacterized protein
MKIQAFASNSLTESIVSFAQFARSHGLNIGIGETQDAFSALGEWHFNRRSTFKFALKPIFCTSPEEGQLFERLFSLYWDTNPIDLDGKSKTTVQGASQKKQAGSLVMLGEGKNELDTTEGKSVSGAHETQRLRQTDFSKLSDIEASRLEQIANRLFREMALRLRRRTKESPRSGQIQLRRTIRRSIGTGGEPIQLYYCGSSLPSRSTSASWKPLFSAPGSPASVAPWPPTTSTTPRRC